MEAPFIEAVPAKGVVLLPLTTSSKFFSTPPPFSAPVPSPAPDPARIGTIPSQDRGYPPGEMYGIGSTPVAFMQEDFLVDHVVSSLWQYAKY